MTVRKPVERTTVRQKFMAIGALGAAALIVTGFASPGIATSSGGSGAGATPTSGTATGTGVCRDGDGNIVGAVIDDGVMQLGVRAEGDLNIETSDGCGDASASGTTATGLRYLPTNNDSTAAGCLCEGWGAGDASVNFSGAANVSSDGVHGLSVNKFTYTPTTAVSDTEVGAGSARLRVVQDYHPFSTNAHLYQDTVTMTNDSAGTLPDVRYRRTMDWDMEPTEFHEFVTINGSAPPPSGHLLDDNDNGFCSSDPLTGCGQLLFSGFADTSGPYDHGANFDFGFGSLAPGASVTFSIFYGADGTRSAALSDVASARAEVYSLGEPNDGSGNVSDTPNTAIFAFSGIGEGALAGSDPRPPLSLTVFDNDLGGSPDSHDIISQLSNPTSADAHGVTTSISFPTGSPLLLKAGEPKSYSVGTLGAGSTTQRDWKVTVPAATCTAASYAYTVTASDTDGDSRTVSGSIPVPAKTCSSALTLTTPDQTVKGGTVYNGVVGSGNKGTGPVTATATGFGYTVPVPVANGSAANSYLLTARLSIPKVSKTTHFSVVFKVTDSTKATVTSTATYTITP